MVVQGHGGAVAVRWRGGFCGGGVGHTLNSSRPNSPSISNPPPMVGFRVMAMSYGFGSS
jgi:hypothetical protein